MDRGGMVEGGNEVIQALLAPNGQTQLFSTIKVVASCM